MRHFNDSSRSPPLVAATVVVRRRRPRTARSPVVSRHRLSCRASAAAATPGTPGRHADLRRHHQRHLAGAVHADRAVPDDLRRQRARRRCASPLKDIGPTAPTAPTTNNEVTITAVPRRLSSAPTAATRRASTCRTRSTAPSPAPCRPARRRSDSSWCARREAGIAARAAEDQPEHHHHDRARHLLRHATGPATQSARPDQIQIDFGNFGDF